jgi:hypothetical protein
LDVAEFVDERIDCLVTCCCGATGLRASLVLTTVMFESRREAVWCDSG